jgi:high-affinity K+ transport system ATPase subunit B
MAVPSSNVSSVPTVHLWVLYHCVLSQVAMGPLLDATMWDLEIQGKTAVCVALDGTIRGVLGLADTAKPEAYSTIRALQGMHMDVWMVRSICFANASQYCGFQNSCVV